MHFNSTQNYKLKMNKLITSGLIILYLVMAPFSSALGKKKPAVVQQEVSFYEKLVNQEGCIAVKSDFISLYKVNGTTLYMELPLKYIGRDILISTGITKTTNIESLKIGDKVNCVHVRFSFENDEIYLRKVNSRIAYDKTDPLLTQAVKATYMDRYIDKYKIETYNPDKTSVVINVTNLFVSDNREFSPVESRFNRLKATFNKSLSYLGEMKAFADNAMIKSILSYDYQPAGARGGPWSAAGVNIWSMEVTRSILLLPEDVMKPRIADSRIGLLAQPVLEIDYSDSDRLNEYSYAQRWRLEPKDAKAWAKGELVEPVKQIVFYVDDSFPEAWKPGIKAGILAWNDTFEKIGFKNVMQALDFPADDPDFDPDNLKYSCIRYVGDEGLGGRGPAWVDPRSGEFINASVMIYGNLAGYMGIRRFIETAQVDPRARTVKMSDDLTQEAVFDIISHEIGHTIGLAHNMAGSAAYPVDSLRSATFTQKYGISASIMDYIKYNYVAQPGDKGLKLNKPTIGVYDELCIKYVYALIPGNLSVKEEAAIAEKWLDEKAGDPMYRYGVQQWNPFYDPSTLIDDLGDDPIKAGMYGVKNLKYILSNMGTWLPEPEHTPHVYELYKEIVKQYNLYIKNAAYNVGGIYLTRVKPGTAGETFKAVPAEAQKKSVEWILNELKNCDWINYPELTSKFSLSLDRSVEICTNGMKALIGAADNVVLASHITDEPYTTGMYFDDLYKGVWENTINNKKLSEGDKIMQRLFINALYAEMESAEKSGKIFDQTGFETAYALTPSHGAQTKIDVSVISEKAAYSQLMLEKIKTLIDAKIKTANSADKAHYKTILNALE